MQFQTNSQLQLAYDFIQYTNQNVFLTGKAGTGKTTFLHNLRRKSPKRMVVVAPTGVAAINAGGVTIHSFFQVSFGPQVPGDLNKLLPFDNNHERTVAPGVKRFNREKINIIRTLDLLVIDEISMVRADLLDAVDEVLRRFKDRQKPFGGVQLLMIGDLQQLAPVVKEDEWEILRRFYETCYFFSSRALQQSSFVGIELTHIFRQSDQHFIDLLNRVRQNQMDQDTLNALNNRYIPNFMPDEKLGYITLTTHNHQAHHINEEKIKQLASRSFVFNALVEGDFPELAYPTDFALRLKVGAQVMFVKNDPQPEKRFFNGKIGKVVSIGEELVEVICPGELKSIKVEPLEWCNYRYRMNQETHEIEEEVIGRFVQHPLKLAWAITIHKSQGLTFEKAIIDARLSFAHGQVYVALSRCKTLEGMVLKSPIEYSSVKNDHAVLCFTDAVEKKQPGAEELKKARQAYCLQLLTELFDFRSLMKCMQQLLKYWNDERSVLQGNVQDLLMPKIAIVQDELVAVAEKFQVQLTGLVATNLDCEENSTIKERVVSAYKYFSDKLNNEIEVPLSLAVFQSDNKSVRKLIAESLEKLSLESRIKRACLDAAANGFSIKGHLDAKAKALVESNDDAKKSAELVHWKDLSHPELYKQLIAWRNEKAAQNNVTASRVLRQESLLEIAQRLPATQQQLKSIKRLGGKKLEEFGRDLLSIVLKYRSEHGLNVPSGADWELKRVGLSTHELSYELFRNGKSIPEIASERNLKENTIFGHLTKFVADGQIDVFELIERRKYKAIADYLMKNRGKTAGEIRSGLGNEFDFNEIRLVASHLGY